MRVLVVLIAWALLVGLGIDPFVILVDGFRTIGSHHRVQVVHRLSRVAVCLDEVVYFAHLERSLSI